MATANRSGPIAAFVVMGVFIATVSSVGFAYGTEKVQGQVGLESWTEVAVLIAFLLGVGLTFVCAQGVVSKLSRASRVRLTGDGVEVLDENGVIDRWPWNSASTRFSLIDASRYSGKDRDAVPLYYVSGVRSFSKGHALTLEAFTAMLGAAEARHLPFQIRAGSGLGVDYPVKIYDIRGTPDPSDADGGPEP